MSKTSQWVRDSENVKRDNYLKSVQKQKQDKIDWLKEQNADSVFVEEEYISPANSERQLGKVMNTLDFEKKIKSLVPNLHFETNPHNQVMKALYILRNGAKHYLGAYHAGFMPEHSIVKIKEELQWDPEATKTPLNRADLPKSEWVPGKGLVWEEGVVRPGWKKVKKPAGELKRGWRTILIKLVNENLLSPLTVDVNFGEPSSLFGKKAWAFHSGKRADKEFIVPF